MKVTVRKETAFQPVFITLALRSQAERAGLVTACLRILENPCGVKAQDLARDILQALREVE